MSPDTHSGPQRPVRGALPPCGLPLSSTDGREARQKQVPRGRATNQLLVPSALGGSATVDTKRAPDVKHDFGGSRASQEPYPAPSAFEGTNRLNAIIACNVPDAASDAAAKKIIL
jgi:hypothetical protein